MNTQNFFTGRALGFLVVIVLGIAGYFVFTWITGAEDQYSSDKKGKEKIFNDDFNTSTSKTLDIIYNDDNTPVSQEILNNFPDEHGPWEQSVGIAYGENGVYFSDQQVFVHHAGVPHLFQLSDGKLVATFQYFSPTDLELFDVVMYSVSEDNGKTWNQAHSFKLSGFPAGPGLADPFLVELPDGKIRFYYTFEQDGDGYPQLYSALGESIDGTFVYEGKQLSYNDSVFDPAVVYFNNTWHHFTFYPEAEKTENGYANFHSTSSDGLSFTKQNDVYADVQMLGDVILDGELLIFYAGNDGKIGAAYSHNGTEWEKGADTNVDGADPGVVKIADDEYVMVYSYREE